MKWRLKLHSEKFIWLTLLVVESTFMALTRGVVAWFPANSIDAELVRTGLRLAAVLVYWRLFCGRISFERSELPGCQPRLWLACALFFSVALLSANWSAPSTATRVVFALTSIVVAIKEEISFRALLQNLLARRFGNLVAVLGATALFLIYHVGVIPLSWHVYTTVVLAGLFIGTVYVRTQSLWLVIGLHAVYDALSCAPAVLVPPLAGSVALVLLLGCVLLVLKWRGPPQTGQITC